MGRNINRAFEEVRIFMFKRLFYKGPTLATLHEQYAKSGQIDEQAPIKTRSEIEIAAPIEQVWQLLTDLTEWPTIDPAFRNVRLTAPLAVDADFSFELHHFPIRAKFAKIAPYHELVWTGLSLWFKAVDVHQLEMLANGNTRLVIAESFAGVLAPLFISKTQLQKQHDQWLRAFKYTVEEEALIALSFGAAVAQ